MKLHKIFLILSTLCVGAIADNNKPNKAPQGKDDDEVDAYPQIENYLNKRLPKDDRDKKVKMRFFKELLTTIARKGAEGKTYKGKLDLNETHEEVLIILNETLPSQKPLQSNVTSMRIETNGDDTYLFIPIKNIPSNTILIKDKDGGTLIEYEIVK
ncbi:MAG: hypothetical protein KU38_12385 [Sulfurovum sp. FS08-3]|nr:MAG: hypothetical protein KU38_12385 [Sulfurovum sp. FS08-3]